MVQGYLDWFLTFVGDAVSWFGSVDVVPGVSLLGFIIAVGLLCIIIGSVLIR